MLEGFYATTHEYEKSLNFFMGLTKNNLVNDELIADVPEGTLQNSAFFLSIVSITFQLLLFKFSEYANLPIMSLNLTDKLIKFPLELGTIKYSPTIERVRATIALKRPLDLRQRKPCSNTLNLVITLC